MFKVAYVVVIDAPGSVRKVASFHFNRDIVNGFKVQDFLTLVTVFCFQEVSSTVDGAKIFQVSSQIVFHELLSNPGF